MGALFRGSQQLRQPLVFFIGFVVIAVIAAIFLMLNGKVDSFVLLNGYHRQWLDSFFQLYTNVGDGLFAIILGVLLFLRWKKRKYALVIVIVWASTGLLAQIIKRLVQSPRPLAFFQHKTYSFFIQDIMHGGNNSFPSGHTVTAFALATVFACYTQQKWQQLLLLLLACLVGYSRIYLSQHFLADVLGGAILGVLGALICLYLTRHIHDEQLQLRKSLKRRP